MKPLVSFSNPFDKWHLMSICIAQSIRAAGRATHCDKHYFIVMTDKSLGVSAELSIVEKVKPLRIFTSGVIPLIQLRIKRQDLKTSGVRHVFIHWIKPLHLHRVELPGFSVAGQMLYKHISNTGGEREADRFF
ncbi:hypothetical protein H045_06095 [Pseudomonas poae RE*1-1-14]|nr:hypothetical protein H045_06095 [Pseudomonas poae RE*1-1-14]